MKQTVSIVIPVYNEVSRLLDGLREIMDAVRKDTSHEYEILLVDDGSVISAYDTLFGSSLKKRVEQYIKLKKLRMIELSRNIGKGGALAQGVAKAKGEYIVFTDIDCSVPMTFLPTLLDALETSEIVIGSRRLPESSIVVHQPFMRESAGRMYTLLVNMLLGVNVTDVTCGFKGFRRKAALDLFSALKIKQWSFDAELLFLARTFGYTLSEMPVAWSNKSGSRVKLFDTLTSFSDLLGIWLRSLEDNPHISSEAVSACDQCGGHIFRFLFLHHQNWKVQQCASCGLTQVQPRPSKKEVALLYQDDEQHFEPYVDQKRVHEQYFRSKLEQIQTFLPAESLSRQLSLLDIGCLTGVLLKEAEKMDMNAVGVDISKDAVRYCKKEGLQAFHGTIAEYQKTFPRKRYDVITAFEIVEHEYSPKQLVHTMNKLLKQHGLAVLSTPNHGSMWRKVMGKYWPGYTHKEHLYFFDPLSLTQLLESEGFEIVLMKQNDARPFPLSFLFTRGADYVPFGKPVFRFIGKVLEPLPVTNPINPWDDLLIVGRKK